VLVAQEAGCGGEGAEQRRVCPRVVGGAPVGLDGEERGGGAVGGAQGERSVHQRFEHGGVALAAGLASSLYRDDAGEQRNDQEHGRGGQQSSEPAVLAGLVAAPLGQRVALGRSPGHRRVEECRFQCGEIALGGVAPFEGGFEAGASVELAVGPAQRFPAGGGGGEVVEGALTGGVFVEPGPQPGPRPRQRLVGELDGVFFGGHQPGPHQQADDPVARGVAAEGVAGDPGPDGFAVGGGCDQAQQHRAQGAALVGWEALVEAVGGAGDRAADAAGGAVALDGEDPAVAALPSLGQRVRQQRQGAGLALGVAHQEIDETGFEAEPRLLGGAFDGGAQRIAGQGADQMQALFGEAGERGVDGEAGEMIGPHRHHHRRLVSRVCRHASAERSGGVGVAVEGEELLELIHDDHRGIGRGGKRVRQRRVGIGARNEHDHGASQPLQRRHHARPHQRRLATPGGAGDDQQRTRGEPFQAGRDIGVAAEEAVAVGDVVGRQPLVRALLRDRQRLPLPGQAGVLAQDGALQRDQLGPGVDTELVDQRAPSPLQRPQRVGLAAAAVLGQRQRGPTPLP
jgi:hypothetical protein